MPRLEYTLDNLSDVIFPDDGKSIGYFSVMYSTYIDDSKDRGAKRFMTSAGFVAPIHVWNRFREDWNRVRLDHGLRYFKSSECFAVTGEFAHLRKGVHATRAERDHAQSIRAEFKQVILDHPSIKGIGVVVELDEYRKMGSLPEIRTVLPDDPYRAALCSVFSETVRYLRSISKNVLVGFVHDEDDRFAAHCSCYCAFKKCNPRTAKFMRGFASQDDKTTPELQAADLVANHTTFLAQKSKDVRAALLEMRENIHQLSVWDAQYLREVVKNGLIKKGKPIPFGTGDTIAS